MLGEFLANIPYVYIYVRLYVANFTPILALEMQSFNFFTHERIPRVETMKRILIKVQEV